MSDKRLWIVSLSVVLGCLIISLNQDRQVHAQLSSKPGQGPYQFFAVSRQSGEIDLFMSDTTTGEIWHRDQREKDWKHLNGPFKK